MVNVNLFGLDAVVNNTVFDDVMTHSLGACTLVDHALVVVVETCGGRGVLKVHFAAPVTEGEDLLDGLIDSPDFSFAGGATVETINIDR